MAQIGLYGGCQDLYGSSPTFTGLTLTNAARNLKTWYRFCDFMGVTTADEDWDDNYAGTAASTYYAYSTQLRPGIIECSCGTDATGRSGIKMQNYPFLFGAGVYTFEADIYLQALSTAAQEYSYMAGFGATMTGDQVDGVYFRYDRVTNVNWLICTADNSVRTATDSGVAVVAGAWLRLKIVVNATGTSAEYFLNGVSLGVVITNISTTRPTGALFTLIKSVGATARTHDIDWAWLHYDLTTTR